MNRYVQLPSAQELVAGGAFIAGLPGFLRHPLTSEQARATLRCRLERREADFLALAHRRIHLDPTSPYRQLLALAGCEQGDLERLMLQDGLEAGLRTLLRQGVYLTGEEFKGCRPVVRGSATLAVDPRRLHNPGPLGRLRRSTSGSTGPAVTFSSSLETRRDFAVNTLLPLEARGGTGWRYANWNVPGGTAINQLLQHAVAGIRPARWFLQVDPSAPGIHPRYHWADLALRWGTAWAGRPFPRPVFVPVDSPLPIAQWMAAELRRGATPHLHTLPSPAVRICQSAASAGLDLRGAQFTVTGEPFTAARRAAIRGVGAVAVPRYGSEEAGPAGYGCLAPELPDDLHRFEDLNALIQPPAEGCPAGLPRRALLFTTLRASAPFMLLNVSTGDQGTVVRRSCGCPLEQLGWITHLHSISSYEKLTAGGMTFEAAEVIRVVEQVLPARFGGGPLDYQLLDEETEDAQPRLCLRAHPALGPLDERAVLAALLDEIGRGADAQRVMAEQWRHSGILRLERRPPVVGASGKVLHVQRTSVAR